MKPRYFHLLVLTAGLVVTTSTTHAADGTWDGGAAGTATAWATLTNWAGDVAYPGVSGSSANGDIATVKI